LNRAVYFTNNLINNFNGGVFMEYMAHTVGAVVSACGIIYLSNKIGVQPNPLYLIGGAAFGGLIPDIDHPKSLLGSAIKPISIIIKETIGHRTLTHSVLFTLIISILASFFNIFVGVGIGIGMISHIVLDILTPETKGVAFLYPFYKKKIKLW
jgi:inner membrane protein